MDALLRSLGGRIRELRVQRGWSQEEFADVAGVHRTYVGHLERGEKNVSFSSLVRVAETFGITLAELLTGVEEGVHRPAERKARKDSRQTRSSGRIGPATVRTLVEELRLQREALRQALVALQTATGTQGRRARKRKDEQSF